eukprot:6959011-Alexandrium_andersonii.AAC.1
MRDAGGRADAPFPPANDSDLGRGGFSTVRPATKFHGRPINLRWPGPPWPRAATSRCPLPLPKSGRGAWAGFGQGGGVRRPGNSPPSRGSGFCCHPAADNCHSATVRPHIKFGASGAGAVALAGGAPEARAATPCSPAARPARGAEAGAGCPGAAAGAPRALPALPLAGGPAPALAVPASASALPGQGPGGPRVRRRRHHILQKLGWWWSRVSWHRWWRRRRRRQRLPRIPPHLAMRVLARARRFPNAPGGDVGKGRLGFKASETGIASDIAGHGRRHGRKQQLNACISPLCSPAGLARVLPPLGPPLRAAASPRAVVASTPA